MDELMICIRISHTMADVPTVEADAPTFDHSDTEEKPNPVPSASRISDNAAVTNAPAITAAQDTPDECDSFPLEVWLRPVRSWASDDECIISSMRFLSFWSEQPNSGSIMPLLISHARDTPNGFGESQNLNLVFSGSIVFSQRAPVQRGARASGK